MRRKATRYMVPAAGLCMLAAAVGVQAALVHYYRFDEGGGTQTRDEVSTNPQDGTFGADLDPAEAWIPSTLPNGGNAIQFPGVRGDGIFDNPIVSMTRFDRNPQGPNFAYVEFGPDASFDLTDEGTLMCWYMQYPGPDGDGTSPYGADGAINNPDNANWIFYKGPIGEPGDPYVFHNQPSQHLNLRFEGKLGQIDLRSRNPLPVEEWVHIAATWTKTGGYYGDGESFLYVNGEEVAVNDGFGGMRTVFGKFYIGGQPGQTGTGRGCLGAVDEVKVFDTYLSQAEIQAAMVIEPANVQETVSWNPDTVDDAIIMSLLTKASKNYQLRRTTDLVAGNFAPVGPTIKGTGDIVTFYDPDGDPTSSYQFEILD